MTSSDGKTRDLVSTIPGAGWEFYTEPQHDADALWAHLTTAGANYGMELFGLDSMHIRRIEAGILNADSDFDHTTTPYDVGLDKFVDEDKGDFIGRKALQKAQRGNRLRGIRCAAEPHIGGEVTLAGKVGGRVTAGAISPYLQHGVGIVLMDQADLDEGTAVEIRCIDGELHNGSLLELPFYDREAGIPRGKLVDIPAKNPS